MRNAAGCARDNFGRNTESCDHRFGWSWCSKGKQHRLYSGSLCNPKSGGYSCAESRCCYWIGRRGRKNCFFDRSAWGTYEWFVRRRNWRIHRSDGCTARCDTSSAGWIKFGCKTHLHDCLALRRICKIGYSAIAEWRRTKRRRCSFYFSGGCQPDINRFGTRTCDSGWCPVSWRTIVFLYGTSAPLSGNTRAGQRSCTLSCVGTLCNCGWCGWICKRYGTYLWIRAVAWYSGKSSGRTGDFPSSCAPVYLAGGLSCIYTPAWEAWCDDRKCYRLRRRCLSWNWLRLNYNKNSADWPRTSDPISSLCAEQGESGRCHPWTAEKAIQSMRWPRTYCIFCGYRIRRSAHQKCVWSRPWLGWNRCTFSRCAAFLPGCWFHYWYWWAGYQML